jgi:hypothetical protein
VEGSKPIQNLRAQNDVNVLNTGGIVIIIIIIIIITITVIVIIIMNL